MEMNNTVKYNLLCVILVFNSIYFMLSLHDQLAQIYVYWMWNCFVEIIQNKAGGSAMEGENREGL